MFTNDDRRLLRAIARSLPPIARKLDLNLGLSIADLALETRNMTTLADLKANNATILAKVTANTDATAAIVLYIAELKAQLADIAQQLADAIANGAPQAELQALADEQTALIGLIDADTVAEAALVNTEVPPNA